MCGEVPGTCVRGGYLGRVCGGVPVPGAVDEAMIEYASFISASV